MVLVNPQNAYIVVCHLLQSDTCTCHENGHLPEENHINVNTVKSISKEEMRMTGTRKHVLKILLLAYSAKSVKGFLPGKDKLTESFKGITQSGG